MDRRTFLATTSAAAGVPLIKPNSAYPSCFLPKLQQPPYKDDLYRGHCCHIALSTDLFPYFTHDNKTAFLKRIEQLREQHTQRHTVPPPAVRIVHHASIAPHTYEFCCQRSRVGRYTLQPHDYDRLYELLFYHLEEVAEEFWYCIIN